MSMDASKLTILPVGVRLTLTRKGRKATFRYEEDFRKKEIVTNAVNTLRPLLAKGLKVSVVYTRTPKLKPGVSHRAPRVHTVRVEGTVDYSVVAGMIGQEFFCWSEVAELTLRDMFLAATIVLGETRAGRTDP